MNQPLLKQSLSLNIANSRNYLLLFILWPFLAFTLAVANYSQREARKVVYLFLIYYGLTFVVSNVGIDAYRYVLHFNYNSTLSIYEFSHAFGGLYSSDTSVDIYEPLVSFVVSRFTNYHGILFAVFAAVFGYFYLKSINLLHDRYQERPNWYPLIFLVFFVVVIPVTTINGVRMYTAAWIFFFGAYHVVLKRDPRFLLVALSASFVHFSFLVANAVLIIYFLAGNRNIIYLPLAIISFILPRLMAPFIQAVSYRLGGPFQTRYEMYTNEANITARQELGTQQAWFMQIKDDLVFYYLIIAIIIIQLKDGRLMKQKEDERNLFSFMLLFLSFVNFAVIIPALGGRFQDIFFLFGTLYVFLYFMKKEAENLKLLAFAGLFPFMLYAAVVFRQGAETINAWILTPGLGLPLFVPGLSLAEVFLIK